MRLRPVAHAGEPELLHLQQVASQLEWCKRLTLTARKRVLQNFKTAASLGNLIERHDGGVGSGMPFVLAFRTPVRPVHAFGVARGNLRSPLPSPSLLLSRHYFLGFAPIELGEAVSGCRPLLSTRAYLRADRLTPAAALRKAQEHVRATGKGVSKHPYAWAGWAVWGPRD